MRRADASGAVAALVLGDDEVAAATVGVKPLRQDGDQATVAWAGVLGVLDPLLRRN
jgi:histidyl-tRNA synthetase